ncbi:MAG: helix-turn-helix transcriptional regulator [bacterium]
MARHVTKFGRWLHEMMREKGISSQSELGERLQVPPSSVTNWVRGYSLPTPENSAAIAKTFGVSVARAYEAMGRMRPVDETDYRDWIEALSAATPEQRSLILDYAQFVTARHSRAEAVAEADRAECRERG